MEHIIDFMVMNSDILLYIGGIIFARVIPDKYSNVIIKLVEIIVSNKRGK